MKSQHIGVKIEQATVMPTEPLSSQNNSAPQEKPHRKDEDTYIKLCRAGCLEELQDFCDTLSPQGQMEFNAYVQNGLWNLLALPNFKAINHVLALPFLKSTCSQEMNTFVNGYFVKLCSRGEMENAKNLFEYSQFKSLINMQHKDYASFSMACINNHVQVVKYLVSTGQIPQRNIELALVYASENTKKPLVDYFIFEHKLDPSEELKSTLIAKNLTHILSAFELRQLNQNLHDALDSNTIKVRSAKI